MEMLMPNREDFKDLSFTSNIPLKRGSEYSAGYDIQSAEDVNVLPKMTIAIKTGLQINIPAGYYFRICTKSRHSMHNATMIIGGQHVSFSKLKQEHSPEEIAEFMKKYTLYTYHSLDVRAGIIDADYHLPIYVTLRNESETETFHIKKGDAIAQGILEKCHTFDDDSFVNKERTGGFGSTG